MPHFLPALTVLLTLLTPWLVVTHTASAEA